MRMNHLKKAILFLGFGITVLICGIGVGTTSNAYTEEEKAAAKAWLSAHGYSPDAGGASQAYQDYLDGKFDEELGITSEEASTQTSEEESATGTESTSENGTEEKNDQKNSEADSVAASGNKVEVQNTKDAETASTEEGQSVSSENTEEQKVDEKQSVSEDESKEPEKKQQITLYQKEKKDTYLEAVMVVLFSIVLLVVIKGILMLMM